MRLVTAMVTDPESKFPTVISATESDTDDVISAGIMAAVEDWPEYDSARSQPQTFIQQRAFSGAWDYLRKQGSQRRTEQRSMGLLHKADKDQELCDWLKDVFEAAKRVYVDKRFRERRTYPMPLTVAIASLMQRETLSCRGCARLLAKRDDLRAVLKIKDRIPHWRSLANAKLLLAKITGFHNAQETPNMG